MELDRRKRLLGCCTGFPSGEERGGTSLDSGNKASGWHRPPLSILKCGRVERRNRASMEKGSPKSLEKLLIQRKYVQGSFLEFHRLVIMD